MLAAVQAAVRRAPVLLVCVTVALTAVFGALSTQAVQEQGFENFSPQNDVTAALETIDERFSSGVEPVQIIVHSQRGALLRPEGVRTSLELRDQLTEQAEVGDLLVTAPEGTAVRTYADLVLEAAAAQGLDPSSLDEETIVELQRGALAELPAEQAEQATQLLGGGGDGTATEVGSVLLLLDGEAPMEQRDAAVRALPDELSDVDGVELDVLDFRLLSDDVTGLIESDLSRLLAIAFGLIILILIAIYRRPVDVIASLLGLVFTIVWMQGISTLLGPGFLGWTGGMSEMSMAIPILLVGLGVDYGIHLTMRYREERGRGGMPQSAASGAIAAVGAALALATLTTVVGFMTNVVNPLPPLQDFGVFAAVGVASAFLIMVTFVPAVRLAVDRRRDRRGRLQAEERHGDESPTLLGRLASSFAPVATHRPWLVLGVAAALTVAGGVSATGLSTEFSQTEFFPDGSEAIELLELVDEEFGGDLTERTQVLIEGDVEQPGVLAALDEFAADIQKLDGVRVRNGEADADHLLSRTRTILAAVEPAPDAAPVAAPDAGPEAAPETAPDAAQQRPGALGDADREAVADLVEAARAAGVAAPGGVPADAPLAPLADALLEVDPTAGAVVADGALLVTASTQVGEDVDELRAGLRAAAAPLRDEGLEVTVASENILVADVMDELRSSQITGLATTLLASMVILAVAFWFRVREPVLGVLAIASVGLVVAWALGTMAAVGIPFNVMTAMVSALAIGIGVPFGIHVVNRFLEDRHRFEDIADAMRSTLRNTGGALVGSAVTTIVGFGALVLSVVPPFRQFGAVIALTIGFALITSVVVLPAMLAVYERVRRRRQRPTQELATAGIWTSDRPPGRPSAPVR